MCAAINTLDTFTDVQGSYKSWKVFEFLPQISCLWKVLENIFNTWKCWKLYDVVLILE